MAEVDLVEVQLLGLPIPVFSEARQHNEELNREFGYLVAQSEASPGSVPDRLLAVTRKLRSEFGDYTASTTALLDQAVAEGRQTLDLTMQVPAGVAPAAVALGELLEEADRYCAQGALLTLETPPEARRFRHWYLGEFVRQIAGEPPTPYEPADASTD